MSSAHKNLSDYNTEEIPSAKDKKFGIIVSEWNQAITFALRDGCYDTLVKHGAAEDDIRIIYVPGSFELPSAAKILLSQDNPDAVICLGCVIKGETKHDEYINRAVANGIMNLSMFSGKPIIFGVLTPNDEQQAKDRAGGKHGNKGIEAAVSAIKMVALAKGLKGIKKGIGF